MLMRGALLLLCALPCVLGGGSPSPPIPTTVKKTLSSGGSYNCEINVQYGSCMVEVKGVKGKALTVTAKAADAKTSSNTNLFLKNDKNFGWEQQVKFDRVSNVGAGSRRRTYQNMYRTITLPADAIKTQSYYALVQKTSSAPSPTPTPGPDPYKPAMKYTISVTNDNFKNPVKTIALGQEVSFNNTAPDKTGNAAQETYRYFKVDTSAVKAPKSLVVNLAMSDMGSAGTDENTGYSYLAGPSIFITSKDPADLRPDDFVTAQQDGTYAFDKSKWTLSGTRRRSGVVDSALQPAMAWHQPTGATWNTMYVVVANKENWLSRRNGRKLMGGDPSPTTGTQSALGMKMKVTATTVTSCSVPTGAGSFMEDKGRRRRTSSGENKLKFTVDYPVSPAMTANSNALLSARLNANNKEIPPENLKPDILGRFAGCDPTRDRKAWQKVTIPKCDPKTFYAVPQCKASCSSMTGCFTFKTMACANKPTANCDASTTANRMSAASSMRSYSGGVVALVVILALLQPQ